MEDMTAFTAPVGAAERGAPSNENGDDIRPACTDPTSDKGAGEGGSDPAATEAIAFEAETPPPTDAAADDEMPDEGAADAQATDPPVDYAALAAEDLDEIKRIAPSLAGLSHLAELPNALRYATLRDAGLSVEEALYAACHAFVAPHAADNRAHLRSAVPIGAAGTPSRMTAAEMRQARELFSELSEGEIEHLYARCQTE